MYQAYQWSKADYALKTKPMPTSHKTDEKSFVASFIKYLPILQWVFTLFIAIAVFALSQRDLQTTQAQTINETKQRVQTLETYIDKRKTERDKQFEDLDKKMLSKEVFEAYHRADVERMERMEKMMQQILEK